MSVFIYTLITYYVTSYVVLVWVLFAILREVHRIENTKLPWGLYLGITAIPYIGVLIALFIVLATCVSHVFNQIQSNTDEHK